MSDAELCRKNGWTVGAILCGTESGEGWSHTDWIQITAIGIRDIIARVRDGDSGRWKREQNWTLSCRDWKKTGFEELTP